MAQCAHCGKEYVRQNKERYCSTECRGAKKSKKVSCRCVVCGGVFKIPPARSKLGVAKYCSTDCKYAHFGLRMRNRISKTCPVCGDSFETVPSADNDYCSHACAYAVRENKEWRSCQTCGTAFKIRKSLQDICCSWECRVERLRGANHPSWKGGDAKPYQGDWLRQRVKALERDENQCIECGKTPTKQNGENMSVHHLKPYREFDDPNEANRLENLVSLCRSCHARQPE